MTEVLPLLPTPVSYHVRVCDLHFGIAALNGVSVLSYNLEESTLKCEESRKEL